MVYTIAILAVPTILVAWQVKYFHKQKIKCLKYPFYKFRDDLVYKIATSTNHEKYLGLYDDVNSVISEIGTFNFMFFSTALNRLLDDLTEQLVDKDEITRKRYYEEMKSNELFQLRMQFIALLIITAKETHFIFRITLNRLGLKILLSCMLIGAFFRYTRKHPEFVHKYRTIKKYSILNNTLSHCT